MHKCVLLAFVLVGTVALSTQRSYRNRDINRMVYPSGMRRPYVRFPMEIVGDPNELIKVNRMMTHNGMMHMHKIGHGDHINRMHPPTSLHFRVRKMSRGKAGRSVCEDNDIVCP